MGNVLRWVIGVVCNYNTKTRDVNGFREVIDPTEGMVLQGGAIRLSFL
jgi:hypothetical protein